MLWARSIVLALLVASGCAPDASMDPGAGPAGDDAAPSSNPDAGPTGTAPDDGGDPGDLAPAPPIVTAPALLLPGTALYPRVIRLAVGAQAGLVVASVVTPLPSGRMGGTILHSSDDGLSFTEVGHIDDPITSAGLCCATLYELPQALGSLAAGTLLWAASVGGDTAAQPMSIFAWSSSDAGKTWSRPATVATASVPRQKGGLWEPELSLLADGTLACHYSDETEREGPPGERDERAVPRRERRLDGAGDPDPAVDLQRPLTAELDARAKERRNVLVVRGEQRAVPRRRRRRDAGRDHRAAAVRREPCASLLAPQRRPGLLRARPRIRRALPRRQRRLLQRGESDAALEL